MTGRDTARLLADIDDLLAPGQPDTAPEVSEDAMRWTPTDEPDHPPGPAGLPDPWDDYFGPGAAPPAGWAAPVLLACGCEIVTVAVLGASVLAVIPCGAVARWERREAGALFPGFVWVDEIQRVRGEWSVPDPAPGLVDLLTGSRTRPAPKCPPGPVLSAVLPAICDQHEDSPAPPRISYRADVRLLLDQRPTSFTEASRTGPGQAPGLDGRPRRSQRPRRRGGRGGAPPTTASASKLCPALPACGG